MVLLSAGYLGYTSLTNVKGFSRYILSEVSRGTIISSVAGTGQVSASEQIDIKPEVSGKLVYLNIPKGKEVKAGTLLAQIESRDALTTVQSAENDLKIAQLSSQDIGGTAKEDLDLSYSNGLDALGTTFSDLTSMRANLDSMFLESSGNNEDSDIDFYLYLARFYNDNTYSLSFWTDSAEKKYTDMQKKLDDIEEISWALNKSSEPSQIENAINATYNNAKDFQDLIRQATNIIQRYQKIGDVENFTTQIQASTTTTQATQLNDALTLLIKDVSELSSAKSDIVAKKEVFLKIDVNTQSQNLNIQQYKNALANAKDNLSKYYIYAPIDGIISAFDSSIKVGRNISSGTALGSIITQKKIIDVSLNEVDAVKIKIGQKATIALDALPDLTMTGSIIDVDVVGSVNQGVVSYGVKIALDIIDNDIKSGMSGSVNIITETKQNVLTVPNSAVKSKSGVYYVLVLNQKQDLTSLTASQGFVSDIAPIQKTVEIGLADDNNTEIISGLSEGDQVVSKTISSVKTTTPSTTGTTRQATPGLTGGGPPGGF